MTQILLKKLKSHVNYNRQVIKIAIDVHALGTTKALILGSQKKNKEKRSFIISFDKAK